MARPPGSTCTQPGFRTSERRPARSAGSGEQPAALLVRPDWPLRWIDVSRQTRDINCQVPIAVQGGALLALALLRWRRADARLLLAMACVPQSMMLYD